MQFLGRYEVLGEIASGGMGRVYLARVVGEGGFEREVALKVMHEHLLADPEFVAMFLDEARLAARIRHPNVVPTIDVQKTAEGLFLVMEFVEGLSLASLTGRLRKKAAARAEEGAEEAAASADPGAGPTVRLPLEVTLRVLRDVLAGLHEAHELVDRDGSALNLVHRDVSPANVLIGRDGVARITDFGVARAEARLSTTKGGQIKGKLPYMPPEQLISGQVDRRADVYAVGVLMWECLAGRPLFRADHEGTLLAMVLGGAPVSPRGVNPHVPETLDALCMRALSLKPEGRPQTAADFADAIEEAAEQSGIKLASARALGAYVKKFRLNTAQVALRRSTPGSSRGAAVPPPDGEGSVPSWSANTPLSSSAPVGAGPPELGEMASKASHSAVTRAANTGGSVIATDMSVAVPPRRGTRFLAVGLGSAVLLAVVVVGVVLAARGEAGDSVEAGGATGSAASSVDAPGASAGIATAVAPATSADRSTESTATDTTETSSATVSAVETAPQVARPGGRPPPRPAKTARPGSTGSLPSDYFPVEP